MKFKAGDSVIVTNECGTDKHQGKVYNYNTYREPGTEYAVFLDGFTEPVFVGENQLEKLEGEI